MQSNTDYWTMRSGTYSTQHQGELSGTQRAAWTRELAGHLQAAFPGATPQDVRVLDIGCGPGFFSIILAQLGYQVTALDYTESMLNEARANAAAADADVRFLQMDAEDLAFTDASFDAIVSRNLTWNLPHPSNAYYEWNRVLKRGGVLLNYDANWYAHLANEDMRAGYEADRANIAKTGMMDRCLQGDVDAMAVIASAAPLTAQMRPAWDVRILEEFGLEVELDLRVSDRVWSEEELISQASTPLFGIFACKK